MELGGRSVYAILNQTLRTNNESNALPWFSYLKLLGTGLKKLPAHSGNVWRAVPRAIAKFYKKIPECAGGPSAHVQNRLVF